MAAHLACPSSLAAIGCVFSGHSGVTPVREIRCQLGDFKSLASACWVNIVHADRDLHPQLISSCPDRSTADAMSPASLFRSLLYSGTYMHKLLRSCLLEVNCIALCVATELVQQIAGNLHCLFPKDNPICSMQ